MSACVNATSFCSDRARKWRIEPHFKSSVAPFAIFTISIAIFFDNMIFDFSSFRLQLQQIRIIQTNKKEKYIWHIVQGIEEATEFIRSHMDETISEMEKVEKEKVTSAEIITRQIDGKPYYHIKFKKVGEDEYTIGYSSFKLDYVVKWLNDYFEFYGEAKVSCDDNGWIPVQGRLPEDNHKGIYDMQLVTLEDGEVCMGVYNNREKEWWTRKQEGERWYTNKHNVIAWQPLPEPYKEEKKC